MPEITDDELEVFEGYKRLGSVEEISSVINERLDMLRNTAVNLAATTLGYKPNVLAKLAGDLEIKIENDKAYILEGDTQHELAEYAEKNWGDFLPSLVAKEEVKPSGVSYVPQSAVQREAKSSGKKQAVSYIMQRYGWALGSEPVK